KSCSRGIARAAFPRVPNSPFPPCRRIHIPSRIYPPGRMPHPSAPMSTQPAFDILTHEPHVQAGEGAPRSAIVEQMLAHVAQGAEEPFFIVDVGAALDRLSLWRRLLPEVMPFYAVKCCPDPVLLYALAEAGMGFDCASQAEMHEVLGLGVDPSRIIYANPCKQPSHMRYAASHNVPLSVFDSEGELRKHAALFPGGDVLLRIAVDDSHATCEMSCKYGAPLSAAPSLLREARSLGVRVRGVSFHVGSGCYSGESFVDAVQRAASVFDIAASMDMHLDILDVGGGFPGVDTDYLSFAAIAAPLRKALTHHFPAARGVQLIAEPGRFIAASTHTLAVNVIGQKTMPSSDGGEPTTMYFVNDGLYGSFNCVLYDHAHPEAKPLPTPEVAAALKSSSALSSIWGPTCDGLDCIVKETRLPHLPVGQSSWLYFDNMGAYTSAAGSNFNGMPLPSNIYLNNASSEEPKGFECQLPQEELEMSAASVLKILRAFKVLKAIQVQKIMQVHKVKLVRRAFKALKAIPAHKDYKVRKAVPISKAILVRGADLAEIQLTRPNDLTLLTHPTLVCSASLSTTHTGPGGL
ncbi:MAG: hypothetical protein SGPRY_001162, partial [Prymnesium sp.]